MGNFNHFHVLKEFVQLGSAYINEFLNLKMHAIYSLRGILLGQPSFNLKSFTFLGCKL